MLLRHTTRVFLGSLIIWLFSGPMAGTTSAEPRERDVWYVYTTGDQRWGYDHVTVKQQPDGTFAYDVETRLLIDVLGQRQENTERTKCVVTAACEPVSLEMDAKQLSGASKLRGRVEGKQFVLTYEREGFKRTAAIDLAEKPILIACLNDWLASQPSGAKSATCRMINKSSLDLETVTARRVDDGAKQLWDVDLGPEMGHCRIGLDSQGMQVEASRQAPSLEQKQVSAEEAKRITHLKMADRELLMFPVDKPICPVARLRSLTVRLSWKGIAWERFCLEDERQKIVERSESDGQFKATVRIQPSGDWNTDLGYPVSGKEFLPCLAEDRYIKPHDPKIAECAAAWTNGQKTAIGAVRALSSHVFEYLQGGSLIAETLTGPEVLETRQGKCSEHAILFASLARSLGIPTRIALGMRLVGNAWVGHMWDEAFVGRWVTVDSTANEVGDVPSLLKLVHSDKVLGTQPIRWAATESLEVSIVDCDPPASAVAGNLKTGIDGPVYTNAEFGCRLAAPDKTWSPVDASGKTPATVVRFKVPDHDDVLIHFVAMGLPPVFTPAMLCGIRATRFKSTYKEYEVLKNEEYRVHQMSGQIFVFRRAGSKKEAAKMKTTEVLWTDGASCYLLNLIADQASHDRYAAQFFKLLDSFESLTDTAAKKPLEKP